MTVDVVQSLAGEYRSNVMKRGFMPIAKSCVPPILCRRCLSARWYGSAPGEVGGVVVTELRMMTPGFMGLLAQIE